MQRKKTMIKQVTNNVFCSLYSLLQIIVRKTYQFIYNLYFVQIIFRACLFLRIVLCMIKISCGIRSYWCIMCSTYSTNNEVIFSSTSISGPLCSRLFFMIHVCLVLCVNGLSQLATRRQWLVNRELVCLSGEPILLVYTQVRAILSSGVLPLVRNTSLNCLYWVEPKMMRTPSYVKCSKSGPKWVRITLLTDECVQNLSREVFEDNG